MENKRNLLLLEAVAQLLIFLTLILTILNFTIYFQNKKPIIVNTNQFIKNRNPINISSDRFSIIQYFYDSEFHPIIFTLKQNNIINHFTKFDKTKQILSNNRLGLNINCQNATNLNSLFEYEKNRFPIIFNKSYCTNYETNTNVLLGGDLILAFQTANFVNNLVFDLCHDIDLGKVCNNSIEMEQKMELKSYVISFLYENYYFNPEESFAYSKFYDYAIFNTSYDKDLSITITLVQNTVISDDNLLYGFLSPKFYTFYIIKQVNFNEIKRKNNLSDLSLSITYQLDSFENL